MQKGYKGNNKDQGSEVYENPQVLHKLSNIIAILAFGTLFAPDTKEFDKDLAKAMVLSSEAKQILKIGS